jgi:DNA repair exonuclease SbcCD nuclease subunit
LKIALLGDTHFGARGDSVHFHEYFKKFYDEVFFPYLEENNITHVIQLGDAFDRRKYINFNSLKLSKEYFFDRLNESYTSYILVGNHDTYFKNTNDVNSLELLLKQYSNINLITSPTEVEFDGLNILMLPWICPENEIESLNSLQTTRSPIAIGHFEIEGFEMHRGAICDKGLKPNIFDRFDSIYSGHFHTRSTQRNITYIGTPYEMTWSDFGENKGFAILDTSTRDVQYVSNPNKMFHKIWYNDMDMTMSDILAIDFSHFKDTIVKVIIKNKLNPVWFDMFIEKIEKAGVTDLQVVEDHLNLDLEDDQDIVSEAEDTLTILSKYVDQLELKVNKSKLDNLLRSLYNEALSME